MSKLSPHINLWCLSRVCSILYIYFISTDFSPLITHDPTAPLLPLCPPICLFCVGSSITCSDQKQHPSTQILCWRLVKTSYSWQFSPFVHVNLPNVYKLSLHQYHFTKIELCSLMRHRNRIFNLSIPWCIKQIHLHIPTWEGQLSVYICLS